MVDSPGVGSSAAGATPQRGSPARAARAGGLRHRPGSCDPQLCRPGRGRGRGDPASSARIGQRGSWKHPEPAAQGPRGPNQGGGLRSAVVSTVGVRGWKGLYGPLMEGRPASAGASACETLLGAEAIRPLRPNRVSGERGSIQNPPHRGHAAQTRGVYGLRWYPLSE